MSRSVDQRVVQMQFDNAQFERNANTSISTLEKLKSALNLDGAAKGLKNIQNAANTFDMSSMASSISAIEDRFSTFGIAGMQVIQRLTDSAINLGQTLYNKTFGQIKSGGLSRSLNIEKAQTLIDGLGYSWDNLYKTIQDSVTGTAYGLDQAAIATAGYLGAGVKEGKELERILSINANLAAITSADYGVISKQLTDIAAKGKVQSVDALQLSSRGVSVLDLLSKHLGKTQAEVSDMMSKGKISSEMFFDAVENGYNDVADKANETYTGSLGNMKFALSKIGAKYYDVQIKNMTMLFNGLRTAINAVSGAIDPFINLLTDMNTVAIVRLVDLLKSFEESAKENDNLLIVVQNISGALRKLWEIVDTLIGTVGEAWSEVFPAVGWEQIREFTYQFRVFVNQLVPGERVLNSIKNVFKGLFSILNVGWTIFKGLIKVFGPPFLKIFKLAAKLALSVFSLIGKVVETVGKLITETQWWGKITNGLASVFSLVFSVIESAIGWVESKMPTVDTIVQKVIDGVSNLYHKAKPFIDIVANAFKTAFYTVVGVIESILPSWEEVTTFFTNTWESVRIWWEEKAKPAVDKAKAFIDEKFGGIGITFDDVKKKVEEYTTKIGDALKDPKKLAEDAIDAFDRLKIKIEEYFASFKNSENGEAATNGFFVLKEGIVTFVKSTGNTVKTKLGDIKDKIIDFFTSEKWDKIKTGAFEKVKQILLDIQQLILLGVLDVILVGLARFVYGLGGIAIAAGGVLKSVAGLIDSFSSINKANAFTKRMTALASFIKSLAFSLLMVVAAIGILTTFDQEKSKEAITTIEIILGIIAGIVLIAGLCKTNLSGIAGLGVAIALITAAIAGFAYMFTRKEFTGDIIKSAVHIVGGLLILMGLIEAIISAVSNEGKLYGLAAAMIGLGVAVLIVSRSIKIIAETLMGMSKTRFDQLMNILTAVLILLGGFAILGAISTRIGKATTTLKVYVGLALMAIALAASVKKIATAFDKLKSIPLKVIDKGLVLMGILFAGLIGFILVTKGTDKKSIVKATTVAAALALLVVAASYALKQLKETHPDRMWDYVLGLGAIFAEILIVVVTMAAINKFLGSSWVTVAVIAAITACILGIAGAFKIASTIPADRLSDVFSKLLDAIAIFSIIVVSLGALGPASETGALVLLGIGAACDMIAGSLWIGADAFDKFIDAFSKLADVADKINQKAGPIKDAVKVMVDAVLSSIEEAIPRIAILPIKMAIEFNNQLAVVLPALGASILNAMKALSEFLSSELFKDAQNKFGVGLSKFLLILEIKIYKWVSELPVIRDIFAKELENWKQTIIKKGREIERAQGLLTPDYSSHNEKGHGGRSKAIKSVEETADATSQVLTGMAEEASSTGFKIDSNLANSLGINSILSTDAAKLMSSEIVESLDISELMPEIGIDAMEGLGQGFEIGLPDAEAKVFRFGDTVIETQESIQKRQEELSKKTKEDATAVLEEMKYHTEKEIWDIYQYVIKTTHDKKWADEWREAALMQLEGYSKGLSDPRKLAQIEAKSKAVMDKSLGKLRNTAVIESPSKVTMSYGRYMVEGLAIGLEKSSKISEDAAADMMSNTLAAVSGVGSNLDTLIASDASIRPVLDLTNVNRGAGTINGVLDSQRLTLNAINGDISHEDSSIQELVEVGYRVLNAIQNGSDLYLDDGVLAGRINRRLGLA